MLCTSGFVNDSMFFFYNGPCSDMNFATKHRFHLNLLIAVKVDRIKFAIIEGHNFD